MQYPIRTDSGLWQLQIWAAFAVALFVTCLGIWWLPTEPWHKGYMVMGLFFTLGSTFTLAKQVRDNRDQKVDTSGWIFVTWASFGISLFLTTVGLYWLPLNVSGELWVKGYLGIGVFLVVTSTFTLAKTVRDNEEAKQLMQAAQRISQANNEHTSRSESSPSLSDRLSRLGVSIRSG